MIPIELQGVSKKYRRRTERMFATSLKSYFLYDLWHRPKQRADVIWALKDVSLRVKKGMTLGVIGQNGSGKSTLLKLIGGILKADAGIVAVNGRVAALIELGAGFHPELTGRENVIINGMILGCAKDEIKARFDDIVDFAELREYIDDPVRTYSSGMYMRLGFAVAIHIIPDILIIDEILAVGDEKFQRKCLAKMRELRHSGKTILLVSHDLGAIKQMCDEVCLLDQGKMLLVGPPTDVIAAYHRLLHGQQAVQQIGKKKSGGVLSSGAGVHQAMPQIAARRWGTKEAEITNVVFYRGNGVMRGTYRTNEQLTVRIEFFAHKKIVSPVFGVAMNREDGTLVNGTNTKMGNLKIRSIEGKGAVEYTVKALSLLPGSYLLTAAIYGQDGSTAYDHWEQCFPFMVMESGFVKERHGIVYLSSKWRMLPLRGAST